MGTYKTNYHFYGDERNTGEFEKSLNKNEDNLFDESKCSKRCDCTVKTGCKKLKKNNEQ